MRIYRDLQIEADFPNFKRRKSTLFNRLVGINITIAGGLAYEPVYLPLIRWTRSGDLLFFDVDARFTVILNRSRPHIVFVKNDQIEMENE